MLIADDADGGDGGIAVVGGAIEDAVARGGMTTMGSGSSRRRLYSESNIYVFKQIHYCQIKATTLPQ